MTRDWTDQNGRTWKVHMAEPPIEGQPYLVEFVDGNDRRQIDYAGYHPPDQLTPEELQELMNQTQS